MIPHNFGYAKMKNFKIDNTDSLKQKLDLISNLIDIKVAFSKKSTRSKSNNLASKKTQLEPHPTDSNYESLNCEINPLQSSDKEYK
jgi:poly [ADP-ribose] polymerase